MRSSLNYVSKRIRDAESELNLPPGFRFHPTDEELIVHYLACKSQSKSKMVNVAQPLSIIADVDLYKHDPWELPELAMFGTKEWYFFTPRDRKYHNGSRPNRVTGNGYWKATGADKPVKSKSDPNVTVGIKKALVFYAGKGIKGIKTNWIMHEYRLPMQNPSASNEQNTNATTSKLDDWVLCRLYNKKNNPKEMIIPPNDINSIHCHRYLHPTPSPDEFHRENSCTNNSESFDSFENSDGEFGGNLEDNTMFFDALPPESCAQSSMGVNESSRQREDTDHGNEWLDSLSLEELLHCLEAIPTDYDTTPTIYHPNQQHTTATIYDPNQQHTTPSIYHPNQ